MAINLEQVVDGYLEAAEWADKPEGSNARFPKSQIEKARRSLKEYRENGSGVYRLVRHMVRK